MKFIIDAQLPKEIAWIFKNRGFDAINTDDLPDKERTTDNQIREISVNENRIVITKDTDFVDSYFVNRVPYIFFNDDLFHQHLAFSNNCRKFNP